jgi:hypothetical protein
MGSIFLGSLGDALKTQQLIIPYIFLALIFMIL